MEPRLPAEIEDFARSTRELLQRRAGIELARRSHERADVREDAAALLTAIDVDSMEPGASLDDSLAAAELSRAAGAVVLPYPVVPTLCRRSGARLAVVRTLDEPALVDHAELIEAVVTLEGRGASVGSCEPVPAKLARFAGLVRAGAAIDPVPVRHVALWLDLQAAYVLGALEAAVDLAVEHLSQRRQFGRLLSSFQALRFQVVEASLACRGTLELLRYTLWRLHEHPADALVDGLALRVHTQEAAKRVLPIAHQLHGAMGFANEHDLPFITRGVQAAVRLPLDYEATSEALLRHVDAHGFETLFGRFTPDRASGRAPGEVLEVRS